MICYGMVWVFEYVVICYGMSWYVTEWYGMCKCICKSMWNCMCMSMCMCLCLRMRMPYAHVCMRMCVWRICVSMCICVCVCAFVCVCRFLCECVCITVCMRKCVCVVVEYGWVWDPAYDNRKFTARIPTSQLVSVKLPRSCWLLGFVLRGETQTKCAVVRFVWFVAV